jgi:hypothetical protein
MSVTVVALSSHERDEGVELRVAAAPGILLKWREFV